MTPQADAAVVQIIAICKTNGSVQSNSEMVTTGQRLRKPWPLPQVKVGAMP